MRAEPSEKCKESDLDPFDAVSPLDARYYFAEPEFFERVRPFASETAQIAYLAKVEAAIAETLADIGVCSKDAAVQITQACAQVTAQEVYDEERRIQHNVRALVNCIRRRVGPEARAYVHLFATSADIVDTARALCLKDMTAQVVLPELVALERKLLELARRHAGTPQIGRTHGQHAVPVTFGFAVALYVARIGQRVQAILAATQNLRGKFSGAVGAYNALALYERDPAAVERMLMRRLRLEYSDSEISSQIVQPEYVADYMYALASCWGVMANLADDFRHLLRSEIHELRERAETDPTTDVVGSSTMPHKINPKDFENVKSLWKAYVPRLLTVLMDQISEHQRDLTNSASGRFVIEFVTAFAYAVFRLESALDAVEPDAGQMRKHLDVAKDAAVAEPLYILLSLAGHPDAHETVRVLARQSRVTGRPLTEIIRADRSLDQYLERMRPDARALLQDPAPYFGVAPDRTRAICETWDVELAQIERRVQKDER